MTTPTREPANMTFSTAYLATRTIHRRAVEALIWESLARTISRTGCQLSDGLNLTMRLYGAESPILDGSYRLPAVKRTA